RTQKIYTSSLHGALPICEAEQATRPGERPDSAVLRKIIEVIEMQGNMDWSKKYYSEGAQAKIEERKQLWSPENQERWSKEWSDRSEEHTSELQSPDHIVC